MKKTMIIVMGLVMCGRYMAPVDERWREEYRAARARVGKKLTDIVYTKTIDVGGIVGGIKEHLLGETPLSGANVRDTWNILANLRINSYAFGGEYLAEVIDLLLSCFVSNPQDLEVHKDGFRGGYLTGSSETLFARSCGAFNKAHMNEMAVKALEKEGAREQLRNDLDDVVERWKKDPEYGQPAQGSTTTPDEDSVEHANKLLGEMCSPSLGDVFKYLWTVRRYESYGFNSLYPDLQNRLIGSRLYPEYLLLLDNVPDEASVSSKDDRDQESVYRVSDLREAIRRGPDDPLFDKIESIFAGATSFEDCEQMQKNLKKYWDGHLPKFKGSIAGIDQANLDTELEAVNKILLFKVFESILSELDYKRSPDVCRILLQYIPPKLMPEMHERYRSGRKVESEKRSIAAGHLVDKAPDIVKELSRLSSAFLPGYAQALGLMQKGLDREVGKFLVKPGQQERLQDAVKKVNAINESKSQDPNQSGGSVVVEGGSSSSTAPVATFIPASSEIPTTDVNGAAGKKDAGVQTESPAMVEGGVQTV